MFINLTNHSSEYWGYKQINASQEYGEIIDIRPPVITGETKDEEISELVESYVKRIIDLAPACILVQAEYVFTHRLVNQLKKRNIFVVAAVSDKRSIEFLNENNNTERTSEFEFVRYREY